MTMGLACDSDGYDLRIQPCSLCGSRGCHKPDGCREDSAAVNKSFRAEYLTLQAKRLEIEASAKTTQAAQYREIAARLLR